MMVHSASPPRGVWPLGGPGGVDVPVAVHVGRWMPRLLLLRTSIAGADSDALSGPEVASRRIFRSCFNSCKIRRFCACQTSAPSTCSRPWPQALQNAHTETQNAACMSHLQQRKLCADAVRMGATFTVAVTAVGACPGSHKASTSRSAFNSQENTSSSAVFYDAPSADSARARHAACAGKLLVGGILEIGTNFRCVFNHGCKDTSKKSGTGALAPVSLTELDSAQSRLPLAAS